MNRLTDFTLTEQEVQQIFGSQDTYEKDLAWYATHPGGYTERKKIAYLLFLRGRQEESRKLLETIEDEEYRQECLQWYASWGAPKGVIVN